MFAPHVEHVQAHLERVRYGHFVDASADSVYLGAEDEQHFWELVGLRLEGCPLVLLALLRFQRLDLVEVAHGRESLSTYLSGVPYPGWRDEAGALTAILPPHDHSIPHFLKRLRAGLPVQSVKLDPARIEVAFDFRLQNPILIPDFRDAAGPLHDHCYRTAAGHVIKGRSHEVPAKSPDDAPRFLAISSPEQVTPSGTYPLPTIFINRAFLALRAPAPTHEDMMALTKWAPFVPAAAAAESLLPLPVSHAVRAGFG